MKPTIKLIISLLSWKVECFGHECLFCRYEAYGASVSGFLPVPPVFIKPLSFLGFLPKPSFEILASQECRQGEEKEWIMEERKKGQPYPEQHQSSDAHRGWFYRGFTRTGRGSNITQHIHTVVWLSTPLKSGFFNLTSESSSVSVLTHASLLASSRIKRWRKQLVNTSWTPLMWNYYTYNRHPVDFVSSA